MLPCLDYPPSGFALKPEFWDNNHLGFNWELYTILAKRLRDLSNIWRSNCSELGGSEELSAGGEWVEALCSPGAED